PRKPWPAPASSTSLLDSRQPSFTEVPIRMIGLAVVLPVSLLLAPLAAEAQQTGKVYRIGWLAPAPLPTTLDAFRDELRVFGYVESNNLVIEQRYANGKPERLASLVAELVGASADVIVTTGNPAT